MSKLIGKEADARFNAFAFPAEDQDGNPIYMIGLFKEEYYSSDIRSGWLRYNTLVDDLLSTLSSEEADVLGARRISGQRFTVFLDRMPVEVNNRDGKPRYDCRQVKVVGFEMV